MQFAVTFCNDRFTPAFSLAVLDTDDRSVAVLSVTDSPGGAGLTGIAPFGDGLIVCEQLPSRRLLLLDSMLHVQSEILVPCGADHHSVMPLGGAVYLVSTGTDSILRATADPDARTVGPFSPFWVASNAATDLSHLNGLAALGQHILVCGFGAPLKGAHRAEITRSGFVRDLATGNTILGGLDHPHSVFVSDEGDLYVLESRTGMLHVRRADGTTEAAALDLGGYLRGLTVVDGWIAVGSCRLRRYSKATSEKASTSEAARAAASDSNPSRCLVSLLDRSTLRTVMQFDLTGFAREIYDIIPLPPSVDASHVRRTSLAERAELLVDAAEDLRHEVGQLGRHTTRARILRLQRLPRSLRGRFNKWRAMTKARRVS